ncbi:MAG: SRPBCC family protein [Chloroflexi bacterium]|nr:SRPBCC family protein [Chloroflexota bacterium]
MWQNEVSIGIAAPIDQVYRYLADFTRHNEWSMSVATIEQTTPGQIGVGAKFKASEILPTKIVSFARITALDAPHRVGWESTDYRVFRTNWEFRMSAPAGGTHLVQHVTFHPLGLLGQILLLIRKRQVPAENLKSLNRIKKILEQ